MIKVADALNAVIPASVVELHEECQTPEHEFGGSPFPLHCLPPAAEAMCHSVCDAVRVPPSLSGPIALGIMSACIGAGLEINSGSGRTSRANLYTLVSAASGSGKSETLRLLAGRLHAKEQLAIEAHQCENG